MRLLRNYSLEGLSGISHMFDFVLIDKEERTIVIDVVSSQEVVERALSLKVRGYDVGASGCFLIVDKDIDYEVKELLNSIGVIIININRLDDLADFLRD